MSFENKVEQCTYITFHVELGMSLMETKQLLEKTHSGSGVFRAESINGTDAFQKIPRPH